MPDTPSAVAAWLFEEHRAGRRFQVFSSRAADASLAGAYAVQREYMRLQQHARGAGIAGWKIGLTSPTMQALCGIDHPVAGLVLDDRLHASGATVRRQDFGRFGVEFEIAVRLGRDLLPIGRPFTRDDVAPVVEAVAAAMEIVDDRGCDYPSLDVFSLVADNAWNAGIVVGEWRTSWPELAQVVGVVTVDGAEVDRGRGSDVLGHPFEPLAWLANHLAAGGDALRAGQVVMTGSLVRTRFPEVPQRIRYEAVELGAVDLQLD
ncbi:MAG TPA: fumarylacetoacetate hydrolase family protein [Ramlibacter sp.]|nr:fumarylacetoacetate hydrolase family protein [Ramlibacter sp.]